MERDSRKAVEEEGFAWGPDTIEVEIRERVRGMIEAIVEEELEATLGAGRSQRVDAGRTGYRHGVRQRQLTTSLGQTTIRMPRARLKGANGAENEWRSRIIPRYQRRTERVDGALLGAYLSGINSRRLRGALSPLLRRSLHHNGRRCAPPTHWERINQEFRRRTKTQASLPGEDAVLLLLYGLLHSGQIVLRRIDGRNDLPKLRTQLKAA